MRTELEAENRVLRERLEKLQREAKHAHGPIGRGYVADYAEKALHDAAQAREAAAAECRPVGIEGRRQRLHDAFTG